jgi:hypothetical protein
MLTRVTDDEVKGILDTTIDTTPFINTANTLINLKLTGQDLTDDMLYQIELYLAAHLACAKEPVLKSESVGGAKNDYVREVGKGLDSTSYGQMVKMLDSTGILASMEQKRATLVTIRADLTRISVPTRNG